MQFILKTFGTLNYTELHVAEEPIRPGEPYPPMRLIGHFNMTLAEREAFIDRMMLGTGAYFCTITNASHPDQSEVDRVFEEAIHQGASPEPITAAEPPPPSGREVIYQRPDDEGSGEHPLSAPVSIPDPVGRDQLEAYAQCQTYRTRRTCCASFVGDPHGYRCQCADEVPEYLKAGIEGSAQTERIKNARQGGAIDAGEVSGPLPVSYQGTERFVAVCDVSGADPMYRWNAYDRETRRYRMPGFVMNEAAARRTAKRANADPAEYAPRYQWQG